MANKDRIINKNKTIINDNSRSTAYYRGRRKYKTIKHSNYSTINSHTYGTSDNLIVRNSHTTYDRVVETNHDRNRSIFCGLFKISLILLLSNFFIKGVWSTKIESTIVTYDSYHSSLTDETYNYNIKYTDYDYTKKLNQLNSLKNVFDTTIFEYSNVANFICPTDELFIEGGLFYQYNNIYTSLVLSDNPSLIIRNFTGMSGSQPYLFTYFEKLDNFDYDTYGWFYELFVNDSNVTEYNNYYINNLLYGDDEWYSGVVKFFSTINAPIVMIGNFMYDLGVIFNFIFNW